MFEWLQNLFTGNQRQTPAAPKKRDALGDRGENVAARYLRNQGYKIIVRNFRCDLGEIDIVARDGSTLVICEVKTRTSVHYGTPFEAITGQKAARLRRLASHWLDDHDVSPPSVRIDVVSVLVPGKGAPCVERVSGVA